MWKFKWLPIRSAIPLALFMGLTGCSDGEDPRLIPGENPGVGGFLPVDVVEGSEDVEPVVEDGIAQEDTLAQEDVLEGDSTQPEDLVEPPVDVSVETCGGILCDDQNYCTHDLCIDEECSYVFNQAPCNDGDVCSAGDSCKEGECISGPMLDCYDGNPCTEDVCDTVLACIFVSKAEGADCDDGEPCNGADTCIEDVCVPFYPEGGCDDGDPCTNDDCDDTHGCTHSPALIEACRPQIELVHPPRAAQLVWAAAVFPVVMVEGFTADGNGGVVGVQANGVEGDLDVNGGFTIEVPAYFGGNTLVVEAVDQAGNVRRVVQGFHMADSYQTAEDVTPFDALESCDGVSFEGACYQAIVSTGITWGDAEEGCNGWLGHLVSIASEEENGFVRDVVQSECGNVNAWIGFTDAIEEKLFVWTDGTESEYENWNGGEPNNVGNEDVTEMKGNGTWNDASDSKTLGCYVCERPITEPVPVYDGAADPGIAFYLSQDALDDGDHSLPVDDLGTVLEKAFGEIDLNDWVLSPAMSDTEINGGIYDVYLSDFSAEASSVVLACVDGGIALSLVIPNGHADFYAPKKEGGVFLPGDIEGDLYFSSVNMEGVVVPSVDASHQVVVGFQNEKVSVIGAYVDVDGLFVAEVTNGVNDALPTAKIELEESIADQMAEMLGDQLQGAFATMAFDSELLLASFNPEGEPSALAFATDFSSIEFSGPGGLFSLRSVAIAESKVTPHESEGAPRRDACGVDFVGEGAGVTGEPLEILVYDDAVNGLLYAAWLGGSLEFDAPESLFAEIDLEALGVEALSVSVSGMLPPVVSDCGPSGDPVLHVGDLHLILTLEFFGIPLELDVYTSFEMGFSFKVEDEEVSFGFGPLLTYEQELQIHDESMIAYEELFDVLIAESVSKELLEGETLEHMATFPLPSLNFSDLFDSGDGVVLIVQPTGVVRSEGTAHIGAALHEK